MKCMVPTKVRLVFRGYNRTFTKITLMYIGSEISTFQKQSQIIILLKNGMLKHFEQCSFQRPTTKFNQFGRKPADFDLFGNRWDDYTWMIVHHGRMEPSKIIVPPQHRIFWTREPWRICLHTYSIHNMRCHRISHSLRVSHTYKEVHFWLFMHLVFVLIRSPSSITLFFVRDRQGSLCSFRAGPRFMNRFTESFTCIRFLRVRRQFTRTLFFSILLSRDCFLRR